MDSKKEKDVVEGKDVHIGWSYNSCGCLPGESS